MFRGSFFIAGLAILAAAPLPAVAGELAAATCEELWVMRNQIYKNNGYCFTSSKAISYFGIGGCTVTEQAKVPLSAAERAQLSEIRKFERIHSCN